MRTAIGLIGLGLIGGVVPTGLQDITDALQVLAGTAGALTALVICCLASAVATRRQTPPVTLRQGLPFGPGRVVTRAPSPSGAHLVGRHRAGGRYSTWCASRSSAY
jgi:hypothetical protein